MNITVLETTLFPDRETVLKSVDLLAQKNNLVRISAPDVNAADDAWDTVLSAMLDAEKVITV